MSASANPHRNGQVENFEKTLKIKAIYLAGFEKFDDLIIKLQYFIEGICNKGMHSLLGYQAPTYFEARRFRQAA